MVQVAVAHLADLTQMSDAERAGYAQVGGVPRYPGSTLMACSVCQRDLLVGPRVAAAVAAGTVLVCPGDVAAYDPGGQATLAVTSLGADSGRAWTQAMG